MSNIRISWPNRLGAATFTGQAGAWSAALPPSYLATKQIAQVARSASLAGAYVFIDAGSAVEVGTFAAVGHNLTTAGQIRLRGFTEPVPALDVDFTRGASLPPGWSVARSGAAYYIDGSGALQSAAANQPRWHYTGSVLAGLLVEGAATNDQLWCRDCTQAAGWTALNMTRVNVATGVDGATNSASRLTAVASNAYVQGTQILAGGAPYTASVFMRRVSGSGSVSISADLGATSTVVALTTTWQRFTATASPAGNAALRVTLATSGDVVEVDLAQLEAGSGASSPILTTSAAAARAAESAACATGAASPDAGTLAITGMALVLPTSGTSPAASFTGTGAGAINVSSAGAVSAAIGATGAVTLSALSSGGNIHAAMAWAANDLRAARVGVLGTADTSVTAPTGASPSVAIAPAGTSAVVVSRLMYWGAALSNANLQSLSAADGSIDLVSDYDSGLVDAWPAAWVAATTAEQRAGIVGCAVIAPATPQTYRYWRLDLVDAANPAGYLQAGRVFGGSAWLPQYGAVYGASLGYESRDQITEMDSGSEYMRSRQAPRVAQFSLPFLSDAEAVGIVLDMQRRLGSSGEVLFEWSRQDAAMAPARRFLARLRRADPLTAEFFDGNAAQFEARELL